MYRVIFFASKALQKDKEALLKNAQMMSRVQAALAELASNPLIGHQDVKRLKNSEEATFRLRCGMWRILFDIDTVNKIIIVYRIRPRKEGYQ